MRIRVNGQVEEWAAGVSLVELLEAKGIDRRFLVVEYNGEPLLPADLPEVRLDDGDRLELVRPVAGG